MGVHLRAVGAESVVVEIRFYAHADGAQAYRQRQEYKAVASALICPRRQAAHVEALHGTITARDARDLGEALHAAYHVRVMSWERAGGRHYAKRRTAPRRWVEDPAFRF